MGFILDDKIASFINSKLKKNADGSISGKFIDKRTGLEYIIYCTGSRVSDSWFIYEASENDINLIVGDVYFSHIVDVVVKIATKKV